MHMTLRTSAVGSRWNGTEPRVAVEGGGKPVLALLTDVQVNHVYIRETEQRGDGRTETDGKPKLRWR